MADESNLVRLQPRLAAIASGSPAQKHQQAVAQARQSIDNRKRLPRTQEQFLQQRTQQ